MKQSRPISAKAGLSEREAKLRLNQFGKNEIDGYERTTPFRILLRQLTNFILLVLFCGALISFLLAEMVSFWTILGIIAFVIILGFVQEYKAERAMEALRKLVRPTTKVLRGGILQNLSTNLLVPGDILVLEAGDKIPADALIKEAQEVQVDEAAFTGESFSAHKKIGQIILAGTEVLTGRCQAEVVATGMQTKLGQIANLVHKKEEKTPLQLQIRTLAKTLAIVAFGASFLVLILGLVRDAALGQMLFIALALLVAAVPEGLPLTLTLTLAYGMRTLAQEKVLVRKMLGAETLGSTTVICTDKTGTLTKNEMTVEKVFLPGLEIEVTGSGYEPKGSFLLSGKNFFSPHLKLISQAAALCNNAQLRKESGKWCGVGDPTETALLVMAAKAGLSKDNLEKSFSRRQEILFTAERKIMSTLHKKEGKYWVFSKGALERILNRCNYLASEKGIKRITSKDKAEILSVHQKFASEALRVLAIAYKSSAVMPNNLEGDLIFLGLVGMNDPPREGVKASVELCQRAGISVVMITGDHKETAIAIAKKVGIFKENGPGHIKDKKLRAIIADHAITGEELDQLSEREFIAVIEDIFIYARIRPEQKLRIVETFKKKGHVVAMTGDGVNDAPALKTAHIGVAMGIKGTDVAKEASTIILQDDHFSTIVDAVRIGRGIRENTEKFTLYLISRNFTEVTLIILALILLGPRFLPLIALQIIFINTFGEVMPAMSLGLDAAREELMFRKPLPPKQRILSKKNWILSLSSALLMAGIAFFVFWLYGPEEQIEKARSMTFITIIGMILFVPFAFRSLKESVLKTGFLSNKLLLLGVVSTFLLTLTAMYLPLFQDIFGLVPLRVVDWLVGIGGAMLALLGIELVKWKVSRNR